MILNLAVLLGAVLPLFCAANAAALEAKSYQIRNCKFDLLLRPENANNADGTPIVLYPAASWKCMTWKFSPVGDSTFQLQNHFTGKTFRGTTNQIPAAVAQVSIGKDAQKRPTWRFTKLPNGFYRIADTGTGQVLTGQGTGGPCVMGRQRGATMAVNRNRPCKFDNVMSKKRGIKAKRGHFMPHALPLIPYRMLKI
jgi:hypothetical protein